MNIAETKSTLHHLIDRLGEQELQLLQKFITEFLSKKGTEAERLERAYAEMSRDEALGYRNFENEIWSQPSADLVQEPAPDAGYIASLPKKEREKLQAAYQEMGADEGNLQNTDW